MKIYRNSIIATSIISLMTIGLAFLLKDNAQLAIWYDIVIGIFGGAIITLITSIIGYRIKRLEALEEFYLYTKRHLKEINKYCSSAPTESKIDYFIEFYNKDLPDLGVAYRNINFLFDFNNKNKLYIYKKIYQPIMELEDEIKSHYKNYMYYKDGSGKNLKAMESYIDKFEQMIYKNNNYNVVFRETIEELGGKYYVLLYGEKTYRKSLEEENQD